MQVVILAMWQAATPSAAYDGTPAFEKQISCLAFQR
jgi:hypothetical protein